MKEINGLFLFAIFGLLTVIAISTMVAIYEVYSMLGNILVIAIFILFFVGLYGLAFMIRAEKSR